MSCGHCGGKMEIRDSFGPFSYKKEREVYLLTPISLRTCVACGDQVLNGYEVEQLDKLIVQALDKKGKE